MRLRRKASDEGRSPSFRRPGQHSLTVTWPIKDKATSIPLVEIESVEKGHVSGHGENIKIAPSPTAQNLWNYPQHRTAIR